MIRLACLLTAGLFVLSSALLVLRPPPAPEASTGSEA